MNTTKNMQNHKNRKKDFGLLLIADFISSLGAGTTNIALVLDIYGDTQNLMASAVFALITILPQLLIAPFLVKMKFKQSFRSLFVFGEVLCMLQLLVLLFTDKLTIIYIVYFVFSAFFFILECLRAEYLRIITPDDEMQKRQSVSRFTNILVTVVGPLLGGYLVSNYGVGKVYFLGVLIYFFSAAVIMFLNPDDHPSVICADHTLSEKGARVHSMNRKIIFGSVLITFVGGATSILTLEYIYGVLEASAFEYSILQTALAVGSLIGSLIGALHFFQTRLKIVSFIATVCMGILLLSVLLRPGFYVLVIIMTISGTLSSLVMLFYSTELFVNSSNEEMRGNYALFRNMIDLATAGAQPVGALLNNVIGCIYSISSMGGVFIISAFVLRSKKGDSIP